MPFLKKIRRVKSVARSGRVVVRFDPDPIFVHSYRVISGGMDVGRINDERQSVNVRPSRPFELIMFGNPMGATKNVYSRHDRLADAKRAALDAVVLKRSRASR